MTEEELQRVREIISVEGFDYAMTEYGDCCDVEDNKYHRLLAKYRKARQDLLDYVGEEE